MTNDNDNNAWLEKMSANIDKMEAEMKGRKADAKIKSKVDSFKRRMKEMKSSAEKSWEDTKSKVEKEWEDIKASFEG